MKTAMFILAVQPESATETQDSHKVAQKKALCQSSEAFCLLPEAKNLKQPFQSRQTFRFTVHLNKK